MLRHLRNNAIAYLALFVALGGSAYAATELPRNSVGAKQLKRGAVTPAKLNAKLRKMLQAKGQRGAAGAPGAPGAAGAGGPQGPAGPSFGDSVQVEHVGFEGCDERVIAELPVTVAQPSRFFTFAQAEYRKPGAAPEIGTLQVSLVRGGEQVARSRETRSGWFADLTNESLDLYAGGVLMVPFESEDARVDLETFVAAPGSYTVRLIGGSAGGCLSGDPAMEDIALSYVLLGDSP